MVQILHHSKMPVYPPGGSDIALMFGASYSWPPKYQGAPPHCYPAGPNTYSGYLKRSIASVFKVLACD